MLVAVTPFVTRRFIRILCAAACLLALGAAPLAMPQAAAAYEQPLALPLPVSGAQPAALTPPTLDDVTAIAAGGAASCAVTQAGAVYCWGLTLASGEFGFSDTTACLHPFNSAARPWRRSASAGITPAP